MERSIDLDRIEQELLQVAEAQVTGAEIVHGDAHAQLTEPSENPERRFHVGE